MNCHPLRVLLSISSTLMIKEGNTGEFFSAPLVRMVESIMSAVHALFFLFIFFTSPMLSSWYDFDGDLERSFY